MYRYREITPLFQFTCWTSQGDGFRRGGAFAHSEPVGKATITIRIVHAPLGSEEFSELVATLPSNELVSRLCFPGYASPWEHYFLVIDAEHPPSDDLIHRSNTHELVRARSAMLDALLVHTKGGLQVASTFGFRSSPEGDLGVSEARTLGSGNPNIFLFGPGRLADTEHEAVVRTFRLFLGSPWQGTQFGRILALAMSSLRMHGYAGNREHAFLLLIVAFEALFKGERTGGLPVAAEHMASLLKPGDQRFKENTADLMRGDGAFRTLRNSIAHGDPLDSQEDLKAALLQLRAFIQQAVSRLLEEYVNQPPSAEENYYRWVERVSKAQQGNVGRPASRAS